MAYNQKNEVKKALRMFKRREVKMLKSGNTTGANKMKHRQEKVKAANA